MIHWPNYITATANLQKGFHIHKWRHGNSSAHVNPDWTGQKWFQHLSRGWDPWPFRVTGSRVWLRKWTRRRLAHRSRLTKSLPPKFISDQADVLGQPTGTSLMNMYAQPGLLTFPGSRRQTGEVHTWTLFWWPCWDNHTGQRKAGAARWISEPGRRSHSLLCRDCTPWRLL